MSTEGEYSTAFSTGQLKQLSHTEYYANGTVKLRKGSKVSCIEAWFGNVAQTPKV